jgi:hypothetical protein
LPLAARSQGLADSVVGYSLESASPVWPGAPVSQREPRSPPGAASAFQLGRSPAPDEPAALAVSPRRRRAGEVELPSQSRCVPRLLVAASLRDSQCLHALPALQPEPEEPSHAR